ncbi:efflux RND transporter permease subunit, partial [Nostocales cyanobacterium LEGE 12452]|nr:efflux RND transporter permease subunit [Nostocales cyanobacterium LEGE 12452]
KNYNFLRLSEFCKNTVKRRLEQLDEVGLVDISGMAVPELSIQLNKDKIEAIGSNVVEIIAQIKQQSEQIGSITIKDGNYEYDLRFESSFNSISDIENIRLRIKGSRQRIIRLADVCTIHKRSKKNTGIYNFDGRRSITLAVIKQGDAQLFRLQGEISDLLLSFGQDYPDLTFSVSENQTELLDLSISNLINSILAGALLSIIMIVIFMNRRQNIVIISCIIPISISMTLLGFYIIGISINIVSLAGLLLGMGEIIDSSIIIIESIEERILHSTNRDQKDFDSACMDGPADVIRPLFTSVLTNSIVFLPLLFLSGIAGAIFYDQAVAVSLSLGTSLAVSYFLVPLLYNRLYRKSPPWT